MPLVPALPVLVADDDQEYVRFIREILADAKGQQFEVSHVTRLAGILPALDAGKSQVLLLDILLPDGNGLDWLRANRARVEAAVVVMTGNAEYDLEEIAPGAQDFILKTQIDRYQLVRAIRYAADRQHAHQELIRSREYFQSLIEHARDLITVVDDRGRILYQSRSSAAVLGLPPAAVVGRSLSEFIASSEVARARAMLAAAFAGEQEGASGEFDVYHANGSVRTLEVMASRIPPAGRRRRAVLNSRDVTERRHALDALRMRDEQLRQAQKMEAVGRLAGGIAHDFSNVLTVITAASERLYGRVADRPDAVADVRSILRNCDRAAALTRQLLAFSRQQTLTPQPLDLGQLIKRAARLLKRLIGEHIALEIDIPGDVLVVEADPTQLEQVLMNLAINARDAMPGGGTLRIRVRRIAVEGGFASSHAPMPAGDYVLLEVSDTGTGMTAETAARAFDPFFSTKHPSQGTGLGLSMVYGIIKQTGGYIWIDSAPGQGATFSIYLPPSAAAPKTRARPPAAPGRLAPATILLAEDEEDVRALLRDVLESQGHTVLEANGVAEGVAVAEAHEGRIDLLLTDVVMPGGTGPELARAVVAHRPETKVLYMSGYPDVGGTPQSVLAPGVPFISKPFTRDALLTRLVELLGDSNVHHRE